MKRHHSRMQHLLVLQMALAVTLATGSILAASVEGTDKPAPAPLEQEDPRWEDRRKRAEDFKSAYLQTKKSVETAFATEESLRVKRAELRRDCREDLRKANRDQRFDRISDCVKKDLGMTLEIITARSISIASTAGAPEDLKKLITARNELLRDAVQTILTAIDAGVYQGEEGLLEARKNLRVKYVEPYVSLLPQLRAEHGLSWISHLLVRADSLKKSGTLSEQVLSKLSEADACFIEHETELEAAIDISATNTEISQSLDQASDCIGLLQEAEHLWKQEQAPEAETAGEPQWENRKLRRLPEERN